MADVCKLGDNMQVITVATALKATAVPVGLSSPRPTSYPSPNVELADGAVATSGSPEESLRGYIDGDDKIEEGEVASDLVSIL